MLSARELAISMSLGSIWFVLGENVPKTVLHEMHENALSCEDKNVCID